MPLTDGWSAWYDHMPGKDPDILHVVAELDFPTPGHAGELMPIPDGIVDDPTMISFKLKVTAPDDGVPRVITRVPVSWNDTATGIKRVRIDTTDGTVLIDVEIAS